MIGVRPTFTHAVTVAIDYHTQGRALYLFGEFVEAVDDGDLDEWTLRAAMDAAEQAGVCSERYDVQVAAYGHWPALLAELPR